MRFGYYPGCSLHSLGLEYGLSARAVFAALGYELVEIDDWNCCGATPAHGESEFLALALPLRNLARAQDTADDLLVPCAACYNSLRRAHHGVVAAEREGLEANEEVKRVAGRKYDGQLRIRHALEILASDEGLRAIEARIVHKLDGLALAPYYGCLLTRPAEAVAFEASPEQPVLLDRVVERLGGAHVRWSYKTECCGGSLALARGDLVSALVDNLVRRTREAGAEGIVTACPLCQANLDTRQPGPERVPIFYVTELVGVALGLDGPRKWFAKHLVDPRPVLAAHRLPGGER